MSRHGWIITKDLVSSGDAEGTYGPRNTPFSPDEIRSKGIHFRMRDDDGIVYYKGFLLADQKDGEELFAPLDDFGEPGAGCVEIQYLQSGSWKTV